MRPVLIKMEDENSVSEDNVAPAAKAIEAGCPICLESFKDKAFVDVCFHILLHHSSYAM